MNCCGGAHHEITVRTGASTLTLTRCGHCSHQAWALDGVAIAREAALAHLSGAYRGLPDAARTARTQAERDVRREQREAAALAAREIRLTPEPAPRELIVLLEGWQVLGAAV